jgi:4-hydroxy-tetrahydrodipicolinate synthase
MAIFGGLNGNFLIEEIERGAVGTMPSSDIAWVYVRVMDLLKQGDKAEAWRIFSVALPLIRFELQPGLGVSAAKHNLVARGVLKSAVRHPSSSIDPTGAAELETLRRLVDPA